jgi:asparagine synthase (glutamine-hydrolysing)
MCGIAGLVSARGIEPRMLEAMSEALVHRGPDGNAYLLWREGERLEPLPEPRSDIQATVGFAHRRLTIIDLTDHGAQPMTDPERGLALNYNGEIYNYVELREELEKLGHHFESSGDTEVVMRAYAEWGPDCVTRFVGMWAFALLDTRERRALLSRDRFGIKPLYWALRDETLLFASEIKALLAAGVPPEPNERAVRRYLLTGRVDEQDDTFFAAINRLPQAHNAVIDLSQPVRAPQPRAYWTPPPAASPRAREPRDAPEQFAQLFADSVRVHARSDVAVGSCLSGGLDSSAIVCVAEELRRRDEIPRYSHHGVGYLPAESHDVNERPFMQAVVDRTGIEMTYVQPSVERFAELVPQIVAEQEEPFGMASIAAQWFVFEGARQEGLKVMLDGQGADEVLAGYHGYRRVFGEELLRRRQPLAYARLAAGHRRVSGEWPVAPRLTPGLMFEGTAAWNGGTDHDSPAPTSIALLGDGLRSEADAGDWQVEPAGSLEDALRRHTMRIGLPALLRFEDRNSMAHSIEGRVPFLDHRLVEYAFSLPSSSKLRGAETKSILRRALRDVLPQPVLARRDKIAFRAEPAVTWLLCERHRDSLVEPANDWEARWIDGDEVARLIDSGPRDMETEYRLWRVLNLKLWLRGLVTKQSPFGH